MPAIALWLIGRGVPARLARPLIYGAAIVAIAVAFALWLRLHDRRVVSDDHAKIEAKAAPARDDAATARASDAITNARQEDEAHAVINAAPTGTAVSAPAHELACLRLRRLGRSPAACSGSASGH